MSILDMMKKFFGTEKKETDKKTEEQELISIHNAADAVVTLFKQGNALIYNIQDNDNNHINLKLEYQEGKFNKEINMRTLTGHKVNIMINGEEKYNDLEYLYSGSNRKVDDFLSRGEFRRLLEILKEAGFSSKINKNLFYGKSWEDMQKNEENIKKEQEEKKLREKLAPFNRAEPISEYTDENGRVALSRENGSIFYDIQDKNKNITTFELTYFNYAYHPSDPIDEMTGHHLTIRVNGKEKLKRDVFLGHRFEREAENLLTKDEFKALSDALKNTEFGQIVDDRLFYGKSRENMQNRNNNTFKQNSIPIDRYER